MGEPQPWAPLAQEFPSPSGRLEFYSERAAAAGLEIERAPLTPEAFLLANAALGGRPRPT